VNIADKKNHNSEGDVIIRFPVQMGTQHVSFRSVFKEFDHTKLHREITVSFDCSRVRFIQPFGINILAAMMQQHLQYGNTLKFIPPIDVTVHKYLIDQGFFRHFIIEGDVVQREARGTSVALRQLTCYEASYFESIIDWLEINAELPVMIVRDLVSLSLVETVNNVFDHSGSAVGSFISAQAYPKQDTLVLSVLDLGVGFYESLKPFYTEIQTHSDAIDLAIEEGVSSKRTIETRVRGLGLSNLVGFFSDRGAIEILSHKGYWVKTPQTKVVKQDLPYSFPGTCINMFIDKQKLSTLAEFDSDDVWS